MNLFMQNCEAGIVQCFAEGPIECNYTKVWQRVTKCAHVRIETGLLLEFIAEEKIVNIDLINLYFNQLITVFNKRQQQNNINPS